MTVRVVFIGCVLSSEASLEALLELAPNKVQVVGLMTKKSSTFNADFRDLGKLVKSHQIPVVFVEDLIDDIDQAAWITSLQPDVVFCVGWSKLLGPKVLNATRIGVIGYHPTALPANRGRHPLIWARVLGLRETASSFFLMEQDVDSGPLIDQQRVTIDTNDDSAVLYRKINAAIRLQIGRIVDQLNSGHLATRPQDHTSANTWRKRGAADGVIDWRMSAESVHRLVLALAKPYPGAECMFDGKPVKIWKSFMVHDDRSNLEPGKVLSVSGRHLTVMCGTDSIRLIEHELPRLPKVGEYF
jgi:methionyl-tRNA formyltransferase